MAAALSLSTLAAAPQAAPAPGEVLARYELTLKKTGTYTGETNTAAVNAWAHMSVWDGRTCYSGSVDNRCDRILFHVRKGEIPKGGKVTITMTPNNAAADYDLVVFRSDKSGSAMFEVAHEQNETTIPGAGPVDDLGPIPLPGRESVVFSAKDDYWYLAVVFYRQAAGGYSLRGKVALK